MKRYLLTACRMAKAELRVWRMERAWLRSGEPILREAVLHGPPKPPLRQRWAEWLDAYDAAHEVWEDA